MMWLQVPEESCDTAIVQMNKPQFLEVAKALEKGKLYSTTIILSFSKFIMNLKTIFAMLI